MDVTQSSILIKEIPEKLRAINPDFNFIEYDFYTDFHDENKSSLLEYNSGKNIILVAENHSEFSDYFILLEKISRKRIKALQNRLLPDLLSKDDKYYIVVFPITK